MKILAIKTKDGYYISDIDSANKDSSTYSRSILANWFFDGERPCSTFHSCWQFIKNIPTKVEELKSQPLINFRYELIDPEFISKGFESTYKREDVAEYDIENYTWNWKPEFAHFRSLYQEKSDKQPDILIPVDFEFDIVYETDKIKDFRFDFNIADTNGNIRQFDKKSVEYNLLSKIILPNILLSSSPCKLTSKESYDIVRQFIKENYNRQYAEITSDYNFCFTVKKKIRLSESKISNWEEKIGRRIIPRTKQITHFSEPLFEMTFSPENYKGYTPIEPFTGKNLEDLEKNIKTYCESLIEIINEPIVQCSCCKGTGMITEKIQTNKS